MVMFLTVVGLALMMLAVLGLTIFVNSRNMCASRYFDVISKTLVSTLIIGWLMMISAGITILCTE